MNAAIYLRTSTSDKQDTAMQKQDLEELAAKNGWHITHTFEDKGYTGTNTKRPALQLLLQGARDKQFDAILVWKFDRLARSLSELIAMIKEFDDNKIKFISLKDSVDLSTSQGRLMMHLLGAFAQFEADLIKTRVKAGMDHAKKNGTRSGKPIGQTKSITRINNQDRVMDMRFKQCMTYEEIARELMISKSMVQRTIKENLWK